MRSAASRHFFYALKLALFVAYIVNEILIYGNEPMGFLNFFFMRLIMKEKTRAARRKAGRRAERRHMKAVAFMPWYNKSWRALNRALQDKAILKEELSLAEEEFLLREEESCVW